MGKVRLLMAGAAAVAIAVLVAAWVDAGQEPVRRIVHDVPVPENLW